MNKQNKVLCAKYRNGHFEGVIDVMKRLTKKINPNKIFLGEKDFQQLFLITKYLSKNASKIFISYNELIETPTLPTSPSDMI